MSEDSRPALPDLIGQNIKQIQKAFSEKGIDISRQAIDQWRSRGTPPNRATTVAEVLGLDPHDICPDVFPAPQTSKQAKAK